MHRRLRRVLLVVLLGAVVLTLWRGWPREDDAAPPGDVARGAGAEPPPEPRPPRLEGASDPAVAARETEEGPPPPPEEVERPRVVEGRVLDIRTNEGVPYVQVVGGWSTYDADTLQLGRRVFETQADRDGKFRLRLTEPSEIVGFFEIPDPAWRVFRWYPEGQEDADHLRLPPDGEARVVLWARGTFRLQGVVQDEDGIPLERVRIGYTVPDRRADVTEFMSAAAFTDANGHFDVGPLDEDPYLGFDEAIRPSLEQHTRLTVALEGYATLRIDPREIPEAERDRVRITLTRGVTLAGVVVDDRRRPVPDAVVVAEYGNDWELRRGTRTDATGRWRLETVTPLPMVLRARSFPLDVKYEQEMTPREDDLDMRLVAETIRLSQPPRTVRALGLELVEVDDELRAAYEVSEYVHVLIWHAGDDPEALGIGRLEKGFGLWMVGEKPIQSIEEALDELLAQPERAPPPHSPWGRRKRVVYTFWDERMDGTNTQYLHLTAEQIEALEDLRERLER